MLNFSEIVQFCPYPVVNLHDIDTPTDGFQFKTPDMCRKLFGKNHFCREHYDRLFESPGLIGKAIQCPHGFVSLVVATNTQHIAISGLIPFPRLGGTQERIAAKKNPHSKILLESILSMGSTLQKIENHFAELEKESVSSHAMALHEIRKLNRNVKQTAERLCIRENADDPDLASKELVQIWKSAEIMSQQFDIIEMLANESLTELPLNSTIEVYRIFDKCVRIYNSVGSNAKINLHSSPGFSGKIRACDKTFPIIPTVLLENALKYGKRNRDIDVHICSSHGECLIEVTNVSAPNPLLNSSIFEKGKRATQNKEGSGHGLYLAQLVAQQHGSSITLDVKKVKAADEVNIRFRVRFPLL